jgi:hypothetical protein
MRRSSIDFLVLVVAVGFQLVATGQGQSGYSGDIGTGESSRPVIYVMPNALATPGSNDTSQVVVDSSHNGKEPQVAKIYQELQHCKECQPFSENMIKERADYLLLLQHGGGKGNRWAVSGKSGEVIASGESLMLGNSVKDACLAMAKDWQQHSGEHAAAK